MMNVKIINFFALISWIVIVIVVVAVVVIVFVSFVLHEPVILQRNGLSVLLY